MYQTEDDASRHSVKKMEKKRITQHEKDKRLVLAAIK